VIPRIAVVHRTDGWFYLTRVRSIRSNGTHVVIVWSGFPSETDETYVARLCDVAEIRVEA
jgi:hypothetical protein